MSSGDYISREAATDVLCDACGNAACPKGLIPRCSYYDKMQAVPPADVRPVVHGHWERKVHLSPIVEAFCSNCGNPALRAYGHPARTNYCPECGADMRKVKTDG